MSAKPMKSVLITGCSSGIGRALAVEFARRGHRVFASARSVEALTDLARRGIDTLTLDVDDAQSIQSAVGRVAREAGQIDMLINNAGFLLVGPVAELSIDDVRSQLQTNVIGPIALAQAVIPLMARRRAGRIVNVGSPSGILVTPFGGAYGASKAALHAINEALRMELMPFGIDVILLLPGTVRSNISHNADSWTGSARPDSLYTAAAEGIRKRAWMTQQGSTDTEVFAKTVVTALTSRYPARVVHAGRGSSVFPLLKHLLPDWLLDRVRMRRFGLDAGSLAPATGKPLANAPPAEPPPP